MTIRELDCYKCGTTVPCRPLKVFADLIGQHWAVYKCPKDHLIRKAISLSVFTELERALPKPQQEFQGNEGLV